MFANFLLIGALSAQDYHFSQFSNTPLLVNPAFTGVFTGNQRVGMYYRNQWAGVIASPYKTFGFAFDSKVLKSKNETGALSVGLSLLKDKAGSFDLSTTQALLSVSYCQAASASLQFCGGIQGGVSQRTINFTQEVWDAINDFQNTTGTSMGAVPNSLNIEYSHVDLAGGAVIRYSSTGLFNNANEGVKLNMGASFHHVNATEKSFAENDFRSYTKYIFHVNGLIGISSGTFGISPSFLYVRQGPHSEILGGAGIRYLFSDNNRMTVQSSESAISLGAILRYGDSVIPYIQLEYAHYTVGISYDVCISQLRGMTEQKARGIEITLGYIFPGK